MANAALKPMTSPPPNPNDIQAVRFTALMAQVLLMPAIAGGDVSIVNGRGRCVITWTADHLKDDGAPFGQQLTLSEHEMATGIIEVLVMQFMAECVTIAQKADAKIEANRDRVFSEMINQGAWDLTVGKINAAQERITEMTGTETRMARARGIITTSD